MKSTRRQLLVLYLVVAATVATAAFFIFQNIRADTLCSGDIILYENTNYTGRCRGFFANTAGTFGAYVGNDLNDATSSVVVNTGTWNLYQTWNFEGWHITLGPGRYPGITEEGYKQGLTVNVNDQVSSVRQLNTTCSGAIILYTEVDFSGRCQGFNDTTNYVGANVNDTASSIIVNSGTWDLFADADWSGTKWTLAPGRYHWVAEQGITNDAISSLHKKPDTFSYGYIADVMQGNTHTKFRAGDDALALYYMQNNRGSAQDLTFNYWWNANGLDVLTDAYKRTRQDSFFASESELYSTRMKHLLHGIRSFSQGGTYLNDYYDDMGWLGIASWRAYQATNDSEYLKVANTLWADIKNGRNSGRGGLLPWAKNHTAYFNTIPNSVAVILSARLGDVATAKSIYAQLKSNWVDSSGAVYDGYVEGTSTLDTRVFSYNIGAFIGAALELYKATGDSGYQKDAMKSADYAIANYLTNGVFFTNETGGGDGGLFKGIFIRYLNLLAHDSSLPQATKDRYQGAIKSSASTMSNQGLNKTSLLVSDNWTVPGGAVTDYSIQLSGVMLAEAAATLDTPPPTSTTGPETFESTAAGSLPTGWVDLSQGGNVSVGVKADAGKTGAGLAFVDTNSTAATASSNNYAGVLGKFDATASGTVSFDIKPHQAGQQFGVAIDAPGGFINIYLGENGDILYWCETCTAAYPIPGHAPNLAKYVSLGGSWSANQWNSLAVSWTSSGFDVSLNGTKLNANPLTFSYPNAAGLATTFALYTGYELGDPPLRGFTGTYDVDNVSYPGGVATPPKAPANLTVEVTTREHGLVLRWTDTSTDETSFRIERRTPSSNQWTTLKSVSPNTTTFIDEGLPDKTTYVYRVFAVNGKGDSSPSNEVTGTTVVSTPSSTNSSASNAAPKTTVNNSLSETPTNTTSTSGTSANSTSSSTSTSSASSNTGSAAATATHPVNPSNVIPPTMTTAPGASTPSTQSGKADSSASHNSTNQTSHSGATQTPSAPSLTPPTSLTATARSGGSIDLAWQAPGRGETGFVIERRLTGRHWVNANWWNWRSWKLVPYDWQSVGRTSAPVTSFHDTNLKKSTRYEYRVRSVSANASSEPSAVSQVWTGWR